MARQFRLYTAREEDTYRLSLTGELDMATVPDFEQALRTACADGAPTITVDLSGLAFVDSGGLVAILEGQRLCVGHGRKYRIDPRMSPAVRRLLEITGVERLPFGTDP